MLVPWVLWAGGQNNCLEGCLFGGPGLRDKRKGEGFEGSKEMVFKVSARGESVKLDEGQQFILIVEEKVDMHMSETFNCYNVK